MLRCIAYTEILCSGFKGVTQPHVGSPRRAVGPPACLPVGVAGAPVCGRPPPSRRSSSRSQAASLLCCPLHGCPLGSSSVTCSLRLRALWAQSKRHSIVSCSLRPAGTQDKSREVLRWPQAACRGRSRSFATLTLRASCAVSGRDVLSCGAGSCCGSAGVQLPPSIALLCRPSQTRGGHVLWPGKGTSGSVFYT